MRSIPVLSVVLMAGAFWAGAPAFAEEQAQAHSEASKQKWCQENPQKCAERKAKREAWCKENAGACEKMKARREEMRQKCQADPAACEKKKEEFRARREERRKQCEADPVACEKKKEEFRRRREAGPQSETPAK